MTTLGERIQALRKEKRWSRDDLGKRLGVTGSAVSLWEINKRVPPAKTLTLLCDLFDVQYDYLTGKSEYRTVEEEILNRIAISEKIDRARDTKSNFRDKFLFPDELELIKDYRNTNPDYRKVIRDVAKMYSEKK